MDGQKSYVIPIGEGPEAGRKSDSIRESGAMPRRLADTLDGPSRLINAERLRVEMLEETERWLERWPERLRRGV